MDNTILAKAASVTSPEMFKEFFKGYYKEKMRVFLVVATMIGIALIVFGMYALAAQLNIFMTSAAIAAGGVLIIYPRFAYRRPYKAARDAKIKTRFEFYSDRLREITETAQQDFPYSELTKVRETKDYIFIYHTPESAAVVEKNKIKLMYPSELYQMLKYAIKE